MQNNILKYILGRAKKSVLLPFYSSIYKFKKLANIKILLSKAFIKISAVIKSLFSMRPQKSTDYFYIGRFGIFKKLLLVIILLICLAPIIYFEFFSTDVAVLEDVPAATGEFVYNDMALKEFSGSASILSSDRVLVYKGDLDKGICTGNGELYGQNGQLLYRGGFKDNEYSGNGTMYYPSGKVMYEGLFEANKFNGQGILYTANGSIQYTGAFLNGMKHGAGKLYDEFDGNLIYDGSFVEDRYDGNGTLYSQNGAVIYTGAFKNNLYDGTGTLYDENTTRPIYRGEFREGSKDGAGTLYGPTGRSLFTGNFLKGFIDYAYFLNLPTTELSKYFSDTPTMLSSENMNYITYNNLHASFQVDSINLEDMDSEEISQPVINSVAVYDGNRPIGLEDCNSVSEFKNKLGEPVYEGFTYALPQDLIALKSLFDNSRIDKNNKLYNKISLIDDLEIEFLLEPSMELYLICYEYSGCSLNLFFDSKDGNLMYYALENSESN